MASALALLFALASASAQVKPRQHAEEPLTLSFATKASVGCAMEWGELNATPSATTTLAYAGLSSWSQHAPVNLTVKPGQVYQLHLAAAAASWTSTEIRFSAPAGYQAYVNGRATDSFVAAPVSGVTDHWYAQVMVLPNDASLLLAPGVALPPRVGDFLWAVGLGRSADGRPAGLVQLREASLATVFDPAALLVTALSNDVVIKTDANGHLKQIKAPQTYVNVTGGTNAYALEFYDPTAVTGTDANGYYTLEASSTPYVTYGLSNSNGHLLIEQDDNVTAKNWTVQDNNPGWTVTETDALRTVTYASTAPSSGQRTETVTVADAHGTASKLSRVYQQMAYGQEDLLAETADPDGAALTTTYAYYDQTSDPTGSYGKLKSVLRPDGSWEKYTYYGDYRSSAWTDFERYGQLKAVYRPWQDGPATPADATDTNCDLTLLDYAPRYHAYNEVVAHAEEKLLGTTVRRTDLNPTFEPAVANAFTTASAEYWQPLRIDTIQTYTAASAAVATVQKTYAADADPEYAGRLYAQENPDGSKVSAFFSRGTYASGLFTPSATGTLWGQTLYSGWTTAVDSSAVLLDHNGAYTLDPLYLVPRRSTRTLSVIEPTPTGQIVHTITQIYNTGDPAQDANWATLDQTDATTIGDHLATRTSSNGAEETHTWSLDTKLSDIAGDGTVTSYTYNFLGQVTCSAQDGIAASGTYAAQAARYTHLRYDAQGRAIWQRSNTSTDETAPGPTAASTYSLAGLLTSQTDPDGLVTTYSYDLPNRHATVTYPGGATKTVETARDGSIKSITGTAVVPSWQTTAINTDGTLTTTRCSLRESDLANPASAPRWSRVTTDWAGRPTQQEAPAPDSSTAAKHYYYDTAGRLYKTTEPGLADALIVYNAFGEAYRSGLDINANGTLDPASSDRLSETATTVVQESSAWWLVQTASGYNQTDNATPYSQGSTKTRLTGFAAVRATLRQETLSTDLFDNQTRQTLDVDRANRLVTQTTDLSDSTTDAIGIARNGLPQSTQNAQGLISRAYYDDLGRILKQTDPRTDPNPTPARIAYSATSNRVLSRQDTAGNTTTFSYDTATGRLASSTDPLGKTSYLGYNLRGQVLHTWGQTTYPVENTYNDYGEQTAMSTYRAGTGWTGGTWPAASTGTADTTTWAYDPATGALLSKTDAAGKTVAYAYNQRGQLATRTWARGVTTTYAYDLNTAEARDVVYSDSTPAVHYTYNRLGQTDTLADATGSRTLAHCVCGKVLSETLDSTFFGGRVLSQQIDQTNAGTLGRTIGLTLSGAGNTGTDYHVDYSYDSTGRFNALASGGATFTYSTVANSNLIAAVTETSGWSETMTYESNRNLLASIAGQYGSATKARFAYTHDALGRRTSVADSGEVFSRYTGAGLVTQYGYNDRSEVVSAQSYYGTNPADTSAPIAGRGFTYAYDNIGSRTASAVIGLNSGDVHTTTYTNNALNQVVTRTAPASTDVTGLAPTNATVTVNSQTATRQGEYYYKNVAAASTPLYQSLAISSSLGGSATRYAYLAGTPESYTYDLDGNLLDDGRWHYTWDAENRLTSLETSLSAQTAGAPRQYLSFAYDYLGRRVRKTVANWTGSAYVASVDRKFIYSGWNLIAEQNLLATGYPLLATYAWGLDISGSLTDGGGVSGLLAIFDLASGATHLPSYDANGNLHALVDRATGTITAAYEYSPYGETLRATGSYADKNPFRFSTKYTDTETGYIYYGRRYYDPKTGRWLGRDPKEEYGGRHLYGFVRNNPVNGWDYLGMYEVKPGTVVLPRMEVTARRERPKDDLDDYGGNASSDDFYDSDPYEPDTEEVYGAANADGSGMAVGGASIMLEKFEVKDSKPKSIEPDLGLNQKDTPPEAANSGDVSPSEAVSTPLGTVVINGQKYTMTVRPLAPNNAGIGQQLLNGASSFVGTATGWTSAGNAAASFNSGHYLDAASWELVGLAQLATSVLPFSGAISKAAGAFDNAVSNLFSSAAETTAMRAGQVFEADVLAAQNLAKNTGVWRPTAAQIDSAAFKVIVGDARYTSTGLARGTIMDSVQGGFLEIKGGSSVLDFTYQLRLQTYRSLIESTPYTIQTTRPVSIEFGQWLSRWGGRIEAPPGVP